MKNQQIIQKLNDVNDEIAFLEELPRNSLNEEKIEELRTLRYELEKELHYEQITTAPANQKGC